MKMSITRHNKMTGYNIKQCDFFQLNFYIISTPTDFHEEPKTRIGFV